MARRKGISTNKSKSISSLRKAQHQLGGKTQQAKTQLLGNADERVSIKKEPPTIVSEPEQEQEQVNNMPPTQSPPSAPTIVVMSCTGNNNNSGDLQNKYLHKKFKRASAPRDSCRTEQNYQQLDAFLTLDQMPEPIAARGGQQSADASSSPTPTMQTQAIQATQAARHVCPYCKLACAKPSVLQKHIRAHTNERPYPCEPCGFAFKTKSNLYKHCRSRAHFQRMRGGTGTTEEDNGSDADLSSSNASEGAPETPPPAVVQQQTAVITASPLITPATTITETAKTPIYKPKFHKAALYRDENCDDNINHQLQQHQQQQRTTCVITNTALSFTSTTPTACEADSLTRRISKIISQNEAIVEVVEPPLLQRKYGKINTTSCATSGNNSNSSHSKLANALLRIDQPLNLSKPYANNDQQQLQHHQQQLQQKDRIRQRRYSETQPPVRLDQHPQNPEGSIIKDLLLKARARGDAPFMVGDLPEDLGIGGSQYTCPLCRISFRGADNLETHRQYYCKGELNPVIGFQRSRSVNVQLPERYNPNTLAKLASSTLKAPLNNRRGHKPGDLKIVQQDDGLILQDITKVSAPLPSPGPLLGTTRLVANDILPPPTKRSRTETVVAPIPTLRSLEDLCSSPLLRSQQQGGAASSLQMFGGEVRIVDDASGETKTMRIEPSPSSSAQNSPAPVIFTPTTVLASPKPTIGPETPGRIVVRSGLHSGGTMLHNPPQSVCHIATPLTPSHQSSISVAHQPNVSAPDVAPNITHFRFPPVAVPTLQSDSTTPQTIVHGGRLIPFVPGIPGPNSLNASDLMRTNSNVSGTRVSPLSSPRLQKTPSPHTLNFNFMKNTARSLTVNNSPNPLTSNMVNLTVPSIKIDLLKSETKQYITVSSVVTQPSKIQNGFLCSPNRFNTKISDNALLSDIQTTKESIIDIPEYPCRKSKNNGERSFNFTCIANNVDVSTDTKPVSTSISKASIAEERHFNFENFISKSEILNRPISGTPYKKSSADQDITSKSLSITLDSDNCSATIASTRSAETSYFRKNMDSLLPNVSSDSNKTKFLRPSSLPLKPGTFTPKKHHGITPNAHTLPLISPETPRPAKAFGQLYLNGHAYTYLGLKCSTRVYYCTLNRLQPMYVANQHTLSMYSNWQVCSEACPNPLKMTPNEAMAHYDSRHRPQRMSIAKGKCLDILTHSSYWLDKDNTKNQIRKFSGYSDEISGQDAAAQKHSDSSLMEGFESHEDYIYVRGRGRGKYVCSKCGIRCKKPSMLKKHARTHTDVRPFTCKHCAFSFKTKGNLTKHMKSKAHYKKCVELGINPVPTSVEDNDCAESVGGSSESLGVSGESDSETDSDGDEGNEGETESSDTDESKSRLPEHEAAHCLLSLSTGRVAPNKYQASNMTPGLISSSRPCTYPYSIQNFQMLETNHEKVSTDKNINPSFKPNRHLKDQPAELSLNDSCSKPTLRNNIKYNDKSEEGSEKSSPASYSNSTSIIRQNSVIISNQQIANDMYYEVSTDSFQPMDLTKPRHKSHIEVTSQKIKSPLRAIKMSVIEVGPNEPMKVITNLVPGAIKSVKQNPPWVNDEIMFQAYLTEKALQETKIKQSQYTNARIHIADPNLKKLPIKGSACNTDIMRVVTNVISQITPTTNATNVIFSRDSISIPRISTSINETHVNIDKSSMDTLAEIAACSSKLETNIDTSNNLMDVSNITKCATDNAKIVASEYLKITSEKSKNNENTEEKSDLGTSKQIESQSKSADNMLDTISNDQDLNDSVDQKLSSEHMSARKVVVGAGGLSFKLAGSTNEFSSAGNQFTAGRLAEDGRSVCFVCSKTFSKPSQLRLHINIHYFERPFRCEACAVSFRTKGHLQKHERSVLHHNKVSMASTFGAPTTSNPRPFNCSDCKIAFRIHGHLAKHLRSKMHVMRLECLGKLPFGTYAEIERAGVSLTDIDTTDCDNSLASLQILAQKLHEKDPTKQGAWDPVTMAPPLLPAGGESDSEGEPMSPQNSSEESHKKSLDTIDPVNHIDNLNNCKTDGNFQTVVDLEGNTFNERGAQGTETSSDALTPVSSDIKRKCEELDSYTKATDNKRCKITNS